MDDIFVYIVGLPNQIREMVLPCADGYTVYINEELDEGKKLEAYEHAIKHIRNNDWNKLDVQMIESETHRR